METIPVSNAIPQMLCINSQHCKAGWAITDGSTSKFPHGMEWN